MNTVDCRAEAGSDAFCGIDEGIRMENHILSCLSRRGGATFTDLEDDIPGFAGDFTLHDPEDRDKVLWSGLSSAALHALGVLMREGLLGCRPTCPQAYPRKPHLPASRGSWAPVVVALNIPGQ